ncbi:hypothetical protein BDW02DRAFT_645127 [Decorospora gaudefroyi]|uniref:Uncharacterized protein n=1 Tax=Decorospora gaudefroyi TaxID=184978 RepID=A0A6A5KS03_9PLEO|nr:hypothetical protein BDW02DRAFT_645127 [Decorospora gaudefroyi]
MQPTHSKYDIGSIYWLPARDKVPAEHLHATVHIDSGCFNHPVVILWVNALRTEAIVLSITSFGGIDLLLRHPRDTRVRSLHLPIYPSNTHPDNGSCLFLKDDARLPRNSYVKTENQWTLRTVVLQPSRHEVCTLRKRSYDELVRYIAFHPPMTEPHPKTHGTNSMWRDNREYPNLVAPVVGGHVKPPPVGCWVAQPEQALPPRQIQSAPSFHYGQQILPPREAQRPLATPYIQHNAFNYPHLPRCQPERTPLLQPVPPVRDITHRPDTHGIASEAPDESCAVGKVMGIIVLGISVWVLWRMANA